MSHFASCDWGTTHFRLRLVETNSLRIVAEMHTDQGVAALAAAYDPSQRSAAFARYLGESLASLHGTHPDLEVSTCVISGMASSALGWKELPYAPIPLRLDSSAFIRETIDLPIRVVLISGIRSDDDVMRGEETELLGLCSELPLTASPVTVIMPGTHSKHVTVENQCITGFHTVMTGELFAHLQSSPTLRASFQDPARETIPSAFADGVAQAHERGLIHSLFQTRSRHLLGKLKGAEAGSFLSGLLIGAELSAVSASRTLLAAVNPMKDLYLEAARLLNLTQLAAIDEAAVKSATIRAHAQFLG